MNAPDLPIATMTGRRAVLVQVVAGIVVAIVVAAIVEAAAGLVVGRLGTRPAAATGDAVTTAVRRLDSASAWPRSIPTSSSPRSARTISSGPPPPPMRKHLERLANRFVRGMESARDLLAGTNAFQLTLRLAPAVERPVTSPACQRQIRETGVCRRVSLDEIAASIHEMHGLTTDRGIPLLILNLDFLESAAAGAARTAAQRDGIPFMDLVARVKRRRWAIERARARARGLRLPGALESDDRAGVAMRHVIVRIAASGEARWSVKGWALPNPSASLFDHPLFDDGSHGDEIAADGVYTATVTVPFDAREIQYQFHRDGAPEFVAFGLFPPEAAYRSIPIERSLVAPIDTFGERLLMAERTHPDARGHAVIAAAWRAG